METCDVALKEWDAQVQALEAGRVALVVRKGGIVETRGEFEIEHTRFWLYPTFLHQNPGELRSDIVPLQRENPSPGTVLFKSFCSVEYVWKLTDPERVKSLEPHQCLTKASLERRFKYRNKPWVHALLLRVYTLPTPVPLQETPMYSGCVSWVPLAQAISFTGAQAVLNDAEFEAQRRALEAVLGKGTISKPV
jgi:hypothetical protein